MTHAHRTVHLLPTFIVVGYVISGTVVLAKMLAIELFRWGPGSVTLVTSLGLVLIAQLAPFWRDRLTSVILASGLVGCLEYIPWVALAQGLSDLWKSGQVLIFAGPLGMAIAAVLALPVKWQRDLERAGSATVGTGLLERCALWMGGLCCFYASTPWSERSVLVACGALSLGGALAATGRAAVVARRTGARRGAWGRLLVPGWVVLLLGLAVALDALGEALLQRDHWRLDPAFRIVTIVLFSGALVPGVMAAHRRWGFATKDSLTKAVTLPIFAVGVTGWAFLAFSRSLYAVRGIGEIVIVLLLGVFWHTPLEHVIGEGRRARAPGWVIPLPVVALATAFGVALWLGHVDRLPTAMWLCFLVFFVIWHWPLVGWQRSGAARSTTAPRWLWALRAVMLVSGLLSLVRAAYESPIARTAAELRVRTILVEAAAGGSCGAGRYTRGNHDGNYELLYVAQQSGFVRFACSWPWGCSSVFGDAQWEARHVELDLPTKLTEHRMLARLSWGRHHFLVPYGSVRSVCEHYVDIEWPQPRGSNWLPGFEMSPRTRQCLGAADHRDNGRLSSPAMSCVLPTPCEAPVSSVTKMSTGHRRVTWSAGSQDGVVVGMTLYSCKTSEHFIVEEVRETEATATSIFRNSKVQARETLGSILPCEGAR